MIVRILGEGQFRVGEDAAELGDLVRVAFQGAGLDWQRYVKVDTSFLRPAEVDHLLADASKAKRALGWRARMSFEEMIDTMVQHDVHRLKNGLPNYAAVAAMQA